jgi:hypothetical protein
VLADTNEGERSAFESEVSHDSITMEVQRVMARKLQQRRELEHDTPAAAGPQARS